MSAIGRARPSVSHNGIFVPQNQIKDGFLEERWRTQNRSLQFYEEKFQALRDAGLFEKKNTQIFMESPYTCQATEIF